MTPRPPNALDGRNTRICFFKKSIIEFISKIMIFQKATKILLQLIFVLISLTFASQEERSSDHQKVTCLSSVKLTHGQSSYKLHSHSVNYASGSGQQSVTGFPDADDSNSLFRVKPMYKPDGEVNACTHRGQAIKCGSVLRFQHVNTGNFLHSHAAHKSPISQQQEVSAYDGQDTGDNWEVICSGKYWMRDESIKLKHIDTGRFLFSSKDFSYRHPIPGQLEISAVDEGRARNANQISWKTQEGVYFSDNPIMS